MRGKSPKQANKLTLALVKKWQKLLGLTQWTINIQLNHDEAAIDKEIMDADDAARIMVHTGYLRADVQVNLCRIEDEKDLDRIVCHEMLHIISDPLKTAARAGFAKSNTQQWIDLDEAAVTQLERAFIRVQRYSKGKRRASKN